MADFHEGLCDALNAGLKAATEEIRKLREENAQLRSELKERDPDLWALSEEVQALQMKLASLQTSASTDINGEAK